MSRGSSGSYLSAVFVDYDNIYLSLKRKNDEAAKRFAKNAYRLIEAIVSGALIHSKNASNAPAQRRVVMSRCYGNPVPRRNQSDNSTDMNSFPFVRHHFLRGGFEIIDCPPLTAQLKNSADIRMVMDIRDFLTHDTHFDEFVILSSDADFTPLLHRLRAHARHTIIYANDHTAQPYHALSDGEVREAELIALLMEGVAVDASPVVPEVEQQPVPQTPGHQKIRAEIVEEVVRAVLESSAPQPLEALAERAIRSLGHQNTVATEWGGAGSFRDLLLEDLPPNVRLTEQAPYFAYDVARAIGRQEQPKVSAPGASSPDKEAVTSASADDHDPATADTAASEPASSNLSQERASTLQQSIAQIHKACEAPPLSPPEYRAIFKILADEISTNRMQGIQTITNARTMALEVGIDAQPDDLKFIVDVVGKGDPWFEDEISAKVFAARFRNFVVTRCQATGMQLSSDEIDLIDAWFGGEAAVSEEAQSGPAAPEHRAPEPATSATADVQAQQPETGSTQVPFGDRTAAWWEETKAATADDLAIAGAGEEGDEEFPRIVRNRFRG